MIFLDRTEWHDRSKVDYYLASIVAEIRQFREGFQSNPKRISVEDCLIPFIRDDGTAVTTTVSQVNAPTRRQVEVGSDAVKDPKWAEVNAIAKASWAGFMGVKDLTELSNG